MSSRRFPTMWQSSDPVLRGTLCQGVDVTARREMMRYRCGTRAFAPVKAHKPPAPKPTTAAGSSRSCPSPPSPQWTSCVGLLQSCRLNLPFAKRQLRASPFPTSGRFSHGGAPAYIAERATVHWYNVPYPGHGHHVLCCVLCMTTPACCCAFAFLKWHSFYLTRSTSKLTLTLIVLVPLHAGSSGWFIRFITWGGELSAGECPPS